MVYADADDVLGRWVAAGLPPDSTVISKYLADASVIVDSDPRIHPPVAARVGTEPGLAERARLVVTRMVMRLLTNPDQLRQGADTSGPFSGSVVYGVETLGGLRLTDEDRTLLAPVGVSTGRFGVVGPFVAPYAASVPGSPFTPDLEAGPDGGLL